MGRESTPEKDGDRAGNGARPCPRMSRTLGVPSSDSPRSEKDTDVEIVEREGRDLWREKGEEREY